MAQSHDPMAEIRASFFVECEELLESLQDALSAMADGGHDQETINVVFRAIHSIKGGAGAFGLSALVAFAHRFETVMDDVRSGRTEVKPEAIRLFFQAADFLQDHVRAAREGAAEPEGAEEALRALEALTGRSSPDEDAEEFVDFQPMPISLDYVPPTACLAQARLVGFRPTTALYASGNEPFLLLRALSDLGAASVTCDLAGLPALDALAPEQSYLEWEVRLPEETRETEIREVFDFVEDVCELKIGRLNGVEDSAPRVPPARPSEQEALSAPIPLTADPLQPAPASPMETVVGRSLATPPHQEAAATVRVDLNRIDRLVNLVGELVIYQAMLAQSVAKAGLPPNSAVMTGLEAFMMLTRDIQDSVMMIRAQPVKPLFQRMARIVREASGAVGKEVRLKTEGEATEIDKTVIERLADPLTHMIRNAVDHGLEKPAKRIGAGKPAEGVITLSAQHRSGRVVIEVRDDGAGINRPKVREIAVAKGLIPPDMQLTDAEIDNLLFLPGFSTASQISNLSGRGVGMDVVKTAITALGGRIGISSVPGAGTTFSMSLPLTLAVLDGMVVTVAGETLVVPLSSIVETASLSMKDIRALGPETNVIEIRGGLVSLYDLGAELGYRPPKESYDGGIVLLTALEDGSRAALVVDAIHEQRQVVIKGLAQAYGHIPGISAATILGDGQIALILDPPDLVQTASGRTRAPEPNRLALAG